MPSALSASRKPRSRVDRDGIERRIRPGGEQAVGGAGSLSGELSM